MNERKVIKRITSFLLAIIMIINTSIMVIADTSKYVISDGIVIQCNKLDMQCSTFTVGSISETNDLILLDDGIKSMLYNGSKEISTYYFGDSVISNNDNIYSPQNYNTNAGTVNLNSIIMAEDSISFGASEVNGDDAILYSKNGDINLNCSNATFTGIIYAPNGTVRLEGSNIEVNGIIIAKNVVVRANKFSANYDSKIAYSVYELGFYQETVQPSLSVVEEENGFRLFWNEYECTSTTDIYVRYDKEKEFIFIESTSLSEYVLENKEFSNCDFRIVTNILGEKNNSNIVTLFFDDEGNINEEMIDSDNDLIPDGYEIWDLKTDPYNSDTDNDGIPDGYEVLVLGSDPCKLDSNLDYDKDGKSNLEEYLENTNPLLADTDFDGINDLIDEEATKPEIGQDFQVDVNYIPKIGMFDIVNKYVVDGVEQEYIYNYILQETTYSRNGDTYSIKYLDSNGNVQAVVISNMYNDEVVQDATLYNYSEDGYLLGISNNGVTYEFEYDDSYRMVSSYLNGMELISYNYINNNVSEIILGNGNMERYENDINGNIVEKYIDNILSSTYEYDEDNNVIKSCDILNGINCEYIYTDNELREILINDNLLIKYESKENACTTTIEYEGNVFSQSVDFTEDSYSMKLISDDKYEFSQIDKNVYSEEVSCNDKNIISNSYIISDENDIGESTQQIVGMHSELGDEFTYEYDKSGNIVEVYKYNCLERSFEYNIYDELICEYDYNRNEKRQYNYNKRGNVISSTITMLSDMSTRTIHNYEYNNINWRDLYTSIDGQGVVYDEIGNPLIYGNMVMTWDSDTMLKTVQKDNDYIEYVYDESGNRISKNINGEVTKYITDGNILLGKESNGIEVWYVYNSVGKVIGFIYDDNTYYYEKDIFNSVKNIVDENGNIICSYEYDSWGNILDIEGDIFLAKLNDFRYQSYIYDDETGFYFLSSRYYDSNNYRFVNADCIFSGSNLFMYCNNNPTNYCDPSGKSPIASVYGSSVSFVSDWGYVGIGFSIVKSDPNGGYFYKTASGTKVYFNCYLWALNKYYTTESYGSPGMYLLGEETSAGFKEVVPTTRLFGHYTVDLVYDFVVKDAKKLGYGIKEVSTPNVSVSTNQRLIALRTTTTASAPYYTLYGGWDYHFMKKNGSTWTYKGGRGGRIFEIGSTYTPSTATWDMHRWDTTNGRWYVEYSRAYTSTIKYFVLTYK